MIYIHIHVHVHIHIHMLCVVCYCCIVVSLRIGLFSSRLFVCAIVYYKCVFVLYSVCYRLANLGCEPTHEIGAPDPN